MSFLQDAKNNGAHFMQDTFVERVLISKGKAVGVVGHQNGHKVVVKANKVVVSAGSIHSPAVLKRSGLKNKHIGQHLFLHPVVYAFGKFDEKIDTYQGSIMTAVSTFIILCSMFCCLYAHSQTLTSVPIDNKNVSS